jgi:hypothetical protein
MKSSLLNNYHSITKWSVFWELFELFVEYIDLLDEPSVKILNSIHNFAQLTWEQDFNPRIIRTL